MQTCNPDRLRILAVVQGRGFEELAWHEGFAYLSLGGEWFECDRDLVKAIAAARKGRDWTHFSIPEDDFMLDALGCFAAKGLDPEEAETEAWHEWAMGLSIVAMELADKPIKQLRKQWLTF